MENKKKEEIKVIAIMLDYQGTINNLNDDNAKIFMQLLDKIREKYQADKVLLNISSQIFSYTSILKYIDIFKRNLLPNIMLDTITYMSGIYDVDNELDEVKGFGYNLNKTKVFERNYLENYQIEWFAIIDDSLDCSYIKYFRLERPVTICRPSQKEENALYHDNFMCYSTMTYGFDGVIECIASYYKTIQDFSKEEILIRQREELLPLNPLEIKDILKSKNYILLKRYMDANKINDDGYEYIIIGLKNTIKNRNLTKEELELIQELFPYITNKLGSDSIFIALKKLIEKAN